MYLDDWGYSDKWKAARLGKFTSSHMHKLMAVKGLGEGAASYIKRKIGEELTGESSEPEIDTDATRWGAFYENEGLLKVKTALKVEFMVTRQLITEPGSRTGSTPDGIIILKETKDGLGFNCEPIEIKCPPTYDNYIGLALCQTPYDVLKESPAYFHQTLHQILSCGALRGWFACYHPKFRVGGFNLVEFRSLDLKKELDLMKERIKEAGLLFNEIREKLLSKGVF